MLDLTVSIVNYNNQDLLEKCLRTLFENVKGISYEVIVVDNASADQSVAMLRAKFPNVRVIENSENLFFTRAHNQVLKIASGRYAVILNPDCYFEDNNTFKILVDFMDSHPEAGACGPKVLTPDGKPQGSGDHLPTFTYGLFELLLLNALWPSNPANRWRCRPEWERNNTESVEMIGGACMMVRMETVKKVGLLDEGFLIYWEETDWCKRILESGFKLYFVAEAKIVHFGSKGMDLHGREKKERIFYHSMLYYYKKHYGSLVWLIFKTIYHLWKVPLTQLVRRFKQWS